MRKNANIGFLTSVLMGLALLILAPDHTEAQLKVSDIRVVVRDVYQEKDSVRAVLEMEAKGVSVSPREQMLLFPVIRSGANEQRLLPVAINGRTQQSVIDRAEKLSGTVEPVYASFSTKGRKPFYEQISYNAAIPIEDWMRNAHVAMVQELGNCRGEFHRLSVEIIADGIRLLEKPERVTVYELPVKLPVPPREEIKNRSESGEAQIIYRVGNAEINPALGNNQSELDKIRRSIEDIRRLEGVKINTIDISSYASPEGTWESNLSLSERRAASLTSWIRRNYDLSGIVLSSRGYGEDWDRLAKLVGEDLIMSETEKREALRIIETAGIFDGRESQLMQYNGGRTYRYMLTNLFPLLRRSAYRIEFTIPEYSIETVKEVFNTHPDMLSLYEFYLLANTYEHGSPEFREVIEQASKMYPNEKVNRISMAMFSYLSNDMTAALEFLRGLEDDPEAWLYFSAFHARNNELDKAEYYARKAAEAANSDAAEHLRLIEKYKADEELYRQKLAEWDKYGIK